MTGIKNRFLIAVGAVMAMALTSCNGIMSGIYDEPEAEVASGFGFTSAPVGEVPGTIYVDASSYTDWVYLDFHTMRAQVVPIGDPEPESWDIALHRYDAKTNGALVAETGATGFSSPASLYDVSEDDFSADVWTEETIITDMSTMMDGYLSYEPSWYNPVLSKWLDVDKSTMPPIYTLSNHVYLLQLADGSQAAVRLDNYMDSASIKGYLTISYIYPWDK